jgi:hypothetical protein
VIRDSLRRHKGVWRTVTLKDYDIGIKGSYLPGFHFIEELGSLRICSACGPKNYLNGFFLTVFERISNE